MKLRTSIIAFVLLLAPNGFSQTSHTQMEMEKAAPKSIHCIEIPGSFSHEQVAQSKTLKELQSKKIRRVELIYTRYKEHENFDQGKLNEDRMYRLKQLLPRLKTDNPEIVWIEQTGTTTRREAADYFHGFRIYTGNQNEKRSEKQNEKDVFKRVNREDKGNPASIFRIDNSLGGTFSHPSGTQIHIPENAVVYSDGKRVIGNYTITYREYRDPAEIVFSGIPMTYKDKKGDYQFNSAGMYEIRGTQNGKELMLQKDISIDFNCTKNEAGVNFYEMNDQSGEWTLLRNDLFAQQSAVPQQENAPVMYSKSEFRVQRGLAPDSYESAKNASDSIRMEGNVKGHQYPNLLLGLNSSKFGVYNCDQVYRIENQVLISPKYLDASSKKQIKNQGMVCLIDKAVNASFSFGPRQVTCNSKGENIFLLFTEEGEIYAVKSEKDKRIDLKQKEPEFLMENITDKVKTSDDLKNYLAI